MCSIVLELSFAYVVEELVMHYVLPGIVPIVWAI